MVTGLNHQQGRRRAEVSVPTHLPNATRAAAKLEGILGAVRRPVVVLDEKRIVISANRAFYHTFAVTRAGTVGQKLTSIGDCCLDIPSVHELLDLSQTQGAVIDDYEIKIESPACGRRVLLLHSETTGRRS